MLVQQHLFIMKDNNTEYQQQMQYGKYAARHVENENIVLRKMASLVSVAFLLVFTMNYGLGGYHRTKRFLHQLFFTF